MAIVKQREILTPGTRELIEFRFPLNDMFSMSRNKDGRNGSIINELPEEERRIRHLEYRTRTINRNTAQIWRIHHANANQWPELDKFLTLTFRANVNSIDECDYIFKKFFKRLRYFTKTNIQYQAIRELQERGALHYHTLVYNMPYVPHEKLLEMWNYNNKFMFNEDDKMSGVNIKAIKEGLNEITNYLTSYALKDLLENMDFLETRKTILFSRSLKKPNVLEFEDAIYSPTSEEIEKGLSFIDSNVTYYRYKKIQEQ